jgi:hypothetical protein
VALDGGPQDQPARQRTLRAALDALRSTRGLPLSPAAKSALDASLAPAWQALSADAGRDARRRGRALTMEAAVELALEGI